MNRAAENGIIVDDIFKVQSVDAEGKHFDRVSRLTGISESFKLDLMLDVHSALLPIKTGAKFRFMLATTLHEDGTAMNIHYDPTMSLGARAESFEYIMHGIVYRVEDEMDKTNNIIITTYCSFGGLLMRLRAHPTFCRTLVKRQTVYVLLKMIAY